MKRPIREPLILLVLPDAQTSQVLQTTLKAAGYLTLPCADLETATEAMKRRTPVAAIVSSGPAGQKGVEAVSRFALTNPALPVPLFAEYETVDLLKQAMRGGIFDSLTLPLRPAELVDAVQRAVERSQTIQEWVRIEARAQTGRLQEQVDELQTISQVGQAVTRSLDLDVILSEVVDAAVKMTRAEEGSLLLLDKESGDLYMHAARNFNEEFVRTFRLPIQDTLAGSVVRSGRPLVLDQSTPEKIKSSYLVNNLIYVPLKLKNRVIGVLGVDNRFKTESFSPSDVALLTALADYAVIAIENARLYDESNQERARLETILERIQDGVLVFDPDLRLEMINDTASQALGLDPDKAVGQGATELLAQRELLDLLQPDDRSRPQHDEVSLEDGRIFSVQVVHIPEIGSVLTLHDITYLKKLDRIKNEFVSTVSHDLRSPLTAILGYVELIERAGPTTDMQREFIHRVQLNVQNITSLVDDLVNLGRIESDFDSRRESVRIDQLVKLTGDSARRSMEAKRLLLMLELPESMPPLEGNPNQLRQMMEHLFDNAIKYTPAGGCITVRGQVEDHQAILQVIDTGIGISPIDLPYIFDKFYRGSNASSECSGTGLGLAIVKSIVDNHKGRVWVDSTPGQGSTFTVVLPLTN
jgi:two-component system NtrC family sensor kinase